MDNEAYATDMALDLLDRILVYDHDDDGRITARQALLHPYFRSLNHDASKTIDEYNRDVLSLSQKKKMKKKKKNIVSTSSDNKHQTAGKDNDE